MNEDEIDWRDLLTNALYEAFAHGVTRETINKVVNAACDFADQNPAMFPPAGENER